MSKEPDAKTKQIIRAREWRKDIDKDFIRELLMDEIRLRDKDNNPS